MSISEQSGALVVTTPLTGKFQARGVLGSGSNGLGGAIRNLLGSSVGAQVQALAGKAFDQQADINGTVTTTARPAITPNWRLQPNLSARVNVNDVALPVAVIKLSVAKEVMPFLDDAVHQQTNDLEMRLRNDPFIENAARTEWAQLCRAIPLGAAAKGLPNLWLEIRPTRAIAAQPKIDARAVTLLLGVQAQTRIVPVETKPVCPFPPQLDLVPQANEGTLDIVVPIDIPFTEASQLVQAQFAGKTFPQDGGGAFAMTIKHAAIAASGDRLLISLLVKVKKRGFFGLFGADAIVNLWGRPVLDREHQMLRLADVALDVRSSAVFGLHGVAAQTAVPLLQQTLTDRAAIDLKPFADDAKKRIAAALRNFTKQEGGVSANVTINDLRLTGIAYDDNTLRVIAQADGTVNVAISSLALK